VAIPGIALAMIAGIFKLDIELVMPETATRERVQTMRAYGARVTLHPDGIEGARDYAENKVLKEGYFSFNQFSNENNWKAHYKRLVPKYGVIRMDWSLTLSLLWEQLEPLWEPLDFLKSVTQALK
jgi:hypothetical protein